MADIESTTLWSDSPDKFDEITRNIEFERQRDIARRPGTIFLRTAWGEPVEQIQQLADQNPDMIFYAEHSFEHSLYDTIYTVEYKVGEKKKVIKAEPNYMAPIMEKLEQRVPCYELLFDKITEIFKRLDVEITDPNGDKGIDWVDAETTVTVEHYGYKMQATKYHNLIEDIKVFAKHEVREPRWEEITERDLTKTDNSDLPF